MVTADRATVSGPQTDTTSYECDELDV